MALFAAQDGIILTVETGVTLTGAVTNVLNTRGPDGVNRSLTLTTSGTTGTRTTTATDFPVAGEYFCQLVATFTGPNKTYVSTPAILRVLGRI